MSEKRNLLLLVMDTARKRNLTPYGYDKDTTPFLQKFSDESVVFDNAYSQAPWTLPSHASIFTGKYPSQHGATQESPYLETDETLASKLSSNGYRTGIFSANAWISPHTGLASGYDEANNFFGVLPNKFESGLAKTWKKMNDNRRLKPVANKLVKFGNWIYENWSSDDGESFTPEAIEKSKQFIDRNDEPFFLTLNLLDTHLPYKPPMENVRNIYDIGERPEICQNSKKYNSGAIDIDKKEWRNIRRLYDGELNFLDEQIKSLYGWMESENILENTMVVICSDHGELLGEHNLYGHEFAMYDELLNVPLMIRHPYIGSSRTEDTVELVDLYDTILEFADVNDFRPERSIFNDKYRSDSKDYIQYPNAAFSEYAQPLVEIEQLESIAESAGIDIPENSRFNSRFYTVHSEDMKLIDAEKIQDEIYNVSTDPREQNNLIDEYEASELYDMIAKNSSIGNLNIGESPGVDAVDDSIKDRLSDLGYLE